MLSELNGKVAEIHETAFVSASAHLIGDVRIGPFSSVWPGAVIRADSGSITIGKRSNVQDNSVLHADHGATIGDDVTIGHGVVCHAKKVGDGCLIGNGSVLNDGVELGSGCLIAAGSVITENSLIDPRSIVRGIPGKPIGKVRARHVELQQHAAESYVNRIPIYKAAATPKNPL